jgi:hypothetical protein
MVERALTCPGETWATVADQARSSLSVPAAALRSATSTRLVATGTDAAEQLNRKGRTVVDRLG